MFFDTRNYDDCLTEQEVINHLVNSRLQDFEEFIDKLIWQLDEDKKNSIYVLLDKYNTKIKFNSHTILSNDEINEIIDSELSLFNETSSIKIINEKD